MIVKEYRPMRINPDASLLEAHIEHAADALHVPWVKEKGGRTLLSDEYVTDAKGYVIAVIRPDPDSPPSV